LQKISYGIIGFIALLLVIGLVLPRHSRVEVETRIDAHPATVFALVNDFHRHNLWSPVTASDPNARIVYSGPERGVGATRSWDGAIMGLGTETITRSRPFEYVETSINPDGSGAARTWFELSADGDATIARWSYETDYGANIAGRYIAPLLARIIARDHEQGLLGLKSLAESLPRADLSDIEIEQLVVEANDIAYRSTTSTPEPAAISDAMGDAYFEILTFIDRQGLAEAGAPISITRSFSGGKLLFDAAIPVRGVSQLTPRDGSPVRIGRTYAGNVIRVRHIGPYRNLGETHRKVAAYLAALGLERTGDAWESYVSDPTKVPEAELLTYVYYPVGL